MNLNANQESTRTLYSSEDIINLLTQNQMEPFKTQIIKAIM